MRIRPHHIVLLISVAIKAVHRSSINSLSDKKQFLEIPVSPQAIGARKWLHVETRLDFQHQKAEVTIDGQKYSLDGITIPNPSKANIIFGANIKAIPAICVHR